jgi:hypothetical protein
MSPDEWHGFRPLVNFEDRIWAVERRDDAGALCGFSRITVAVRPMRRG